MLSQNKMGLSTNHVFISFRSSDTRHGFIDHLRKALQQKGIRTFTDDVGFEGGEEISQALINAIEQSQISVVLFSKNYASSTWCLEELVKIVDAMKEKGGSIVPVFYDVDPSDFRHLRGGYGQTLGKQEKFKPWAEALKEAANISGLNFDPRYYSFSFPF